MGPPLRDRSATRLCWCRNPVLSPARQVSCSTCTGSMQREGQVCPVKATCGCTDRDPNCQVLEPRQTRLVSAPRKGCNMTPASLNTLAEGSTTSWTQQGSSDCKERQPDVSRNSAAFVLPCPLSTVWQHTELLYKQQISYRDNSLFEREQKVKTVDVQSGSESLFPGISRTSGFCGRHQSDAEFCSTGSQGRAAEVPQTVDQAVRSQRQSVVDLLPAMRLLCCGLVSVLVSLAAGGYKLTAKRSLSLDTVSNTRATILSSCHDDTDAFCSSVHCQGAYEAAPVQV